jgi:hypothetical protein
MEVKICKSIPEPIALFSPKEVAKAIDGLSVKKASGMDRISAKILKNCQKKR